MESEYLKYGYTDTNMGISKTDILENIHVF